VRAAAIAIGVAVARLAAPAWCGRDAGAWLDGDVATQEALARTLVDFEARDDADRAGPPAGRFAGEWALVTHQMTAIGLAELCLAHPDRASAYAPAATRAAIKSALPEMRDFGTRAWHGEDALGALAGPHGHAYLAYAALAVGMARLVDPAFPAASAREHDALVAAYERRLLASPTGLIDTYPGEAYPTDVAAVAAAIAVHGRVTGQDHARVLAHWAKHVAEVQIDRASGLVHQRMDARTGAPHDAPRGSGTALAAYFAGFADRATAARLADGVFRGEATFAGFSAIREYAPGFHGHGDVDSGPVVLGVSVSATGFALAPARAFGRRDVFARLYRTTDLFGLPVAWGDRRRFTTGGPIGDALLLALLLSGPELAP
jgi:hypothetical protein